ncbi:MAG: HD domain-containing protein [Candidatus Omnitrophota bacterium]
MLDQEQLTFYRNWFEEYVCSFQTDEPNCQKNIALKKAHTLRVCREIITLAGSLNLNPPDLYLAETIALFHDIGRFEQYKRYGTFWDMKSIDHGLLGIKILSEYQILKDLPSETAELITYAISHHNQAQLPQTGDPRKILFTQLVRDADKLDIWQMVKEYYLKEDRTRNEGMELGLPDTPEISAEIMEDLLARKIVRAVHLRTLNDFKLLQLGWLYDVNFKRTFELIKERGYLQVIYNVLPHTAAVQKIHRILEAYLEESISKKEPAAREKRSDSLSLC